MWGSIPPGAAHFTSELALRAASPSGLIVGAMLALPDVAGAGVGPVGALSRAGPAIIGALLPSCHAMLGFTCAFHRRVGAARLLWLAAGAHQRQRARAEDARSSDVMFVFEKTMYSQ